MPFLLLQRMLILGSCYGSSVFELQSTQLSRNGLMLGGHHPVPLSKWEEQGVNLGRCMRLRGGQELEVVSSHGRGESEPVKLGVFRVMRRAVLLSIVFFLPGICPRPRYAMCGADIA